MRISGIDVSDESAKRAGELLKSDLLNVCIHTMALATKATAALSDGDMKGFHMAMRMAIAGILEIDAFYSERLQDDRDGASSVGNPERAADAHH